ncbi:hypothetical protein VVD49_12815 [Uliginosibacterium sp. H3]|uniref:Lipoprotein n=1 Tax=Uliginosibacterium silvisoli TaxID=3114758 RepID=A0ABU6K6J1_9RHOO|nr:hypothetical protein [Uliginosibacterium sp. H3]
MRLSLKETCKQTCKLVPALALVASGLLLSACTTTLQRADANNLTIDCRTDEAIAALRKMEAEGGERNMKIVSENLPGVLLDAGRAADANAEIERLSRKLTTDGDYDKTKFSLGKVMQKTVVELRDDREIKYGYSICRTTRPELKLTQ